MCVCVCVCVNQSQGSLTLVQLRNVLPNPFQKRRHLSRRRLAPVVVGSGDGGCESVLDYSGDDGDEFAEDFFGVVEVVGLDLVEGGEEGALLSRELGEEGGPYVGKEVGDEEDGLGDEG